MYILNKHKKKQWGKNSICCVFTNHTIDFSDFDYLGLQSQLKLAINYPFVFVLPDNIKEEEINNMLAKFPLTEIQKQNISYHLLPSEYFKSIQDYSILMSSEFFYSLFKGYRFILTLQPDLFICNQSKILSLMNDMHSGGYDYSGAPWLYDSLKFAGLEELANSKSQHKYINKIKYQIFRILFKLKLISKPKHIDLIFYTGNGGCSIRRTKKFIQLSKQLGNIKDVIGDEKWNYHLKNYTNPHFLAEDVYWTQLIGRKLKQLNVMPPSQSIRYFWESGSPEVNSYLSRTSLPLSIHAWPKSIFKDFVLKMGKVNL